MRSSLAMAAALLAAASLLALPAAPAAWAAGPSPASDPARVPAVTVQGKTITMERVNSPEIYKARKELYQLEGRLVQELALAELRKQMPGEFPAPEVEVTQQEVAELYVQAGLNNRGPIEDFRERIRDFLAGKKIEAANRRQFQRAVAKGYIETHHQPPPPFLVRLEDVKRKAARGPLDAPVQVVEFSDFQCPYCRRALPTLEALRERYGERLRLVYRHLPLSRIHSEARAAAEASECAAEQGRFWPFHDLVFANSDKLSPKELRDYARRAKVADLGDFASCISQRRYAARVDRDLAAARALGLNGTPSFLIGRRVDENTLEGEIVNGALPLEQFVAAVERILNMKERQAR